MPNVPRVGDLQINQDLDYQRREWTIQRVGWVVIGLIVCAAAPWASGPGAA